MRKNSDKRPFPSILFFLSFGGVLALHDVRVLVHHINTII